MKAELKIGNLVNINGAIAKVLELRENHARIEYIRSDTGNRHVSLVEYGKLSGVTIDPEWLDKFDFFNDPTTSYRWLSKLYFDITYDLDDNSVCIGGLFGEWLEEPIEFVHELQNLFTGLKLPLNQEKLFEIKK